ncbi:MAG: hypothetical protein R6U46_13670 [Marinilabilia sp.]
MSIKEKDIQNGRWSCPGKPISQKDFEKGIHDAELGPFYSIEDSKKILKEWREKRRQKK